MIRVKDQCVAHGIDYIVHTGSSASFELLGLLQNSEWGPCGPTFPVAMGLMGILGAHFGTWVLPKWALFSQFVPHFGSRIKMKAWIVDRRS